MLTDIAEKLHTFFLPQTEQLGMAERNVTFGAAAELPEELGAGYLYVAGLGEDCLLSIHDFVLREDVLLHEYPSESYCISLMSDTTAHVAPMVPAGRLRRSNVLTLYQNGDETEFVLPRDRRCWATTLCFTDEYFEHASRLTGVEPDLFKRSMVEAKPNGVPKDVLLSLMRLQSLARSVKSRADIGGTCAALALQALVSLMESEAHGPVDDGSHKARRYAETVEAAKTYISGNLDRRITLDDLSRELFIGRTALCEAFREAGEGSVGACISGMKLDHALKLLESGDFSVGEVSQAVGYAHQSSFSGAFKRRFGLRPAEVIFFRG